MAGSPFGEGLGTPSIIEITGDAHGRFVYVLNVEAQAAGELIGNPGICGFAVDRATGALTRVPGSPIAFPVRNNNLIVLDGTTHFLFEGNLAGTGFDVYAIDQNSGGLAKTSANSDAPPQGEFAVASADGRFLFSAGKGNVGAFSIANSGNLTLVSGTPVSTRGSAGPMAITPDGKFLYVSNQIEGSVTVFAVANNGALTPVAGSPFMIDTHPQFLALTPDARFLYIPSSDTQSVKGYAVNPTAGTFTPVAGAVVNNATSVTVNFSGTLTYVSVFPPTAFAELVTYKIDPTTGDLTQIAQNATPFFSDDPNDVITEP